MIPAPLINGDRLVVLARTIDAGAADEAQLRQFERDITDAEPAPPGRLAHLLHREQRIYRQADNSPAWTHLEIAAFEQIVPLKAIEAVLKPLPAPFRVLRAEVLVPSPGSYHADLTSKGPISSSGAISIEYIDVAEAHLEAYRNVMRDQCGPAAERLVESKVIKDFRALETAAILHQADDLPDAWNQIHLFDLGTTSFEDFQRAFEASLKKIGPGYEEIFSQLDTIRTMRRWSFSDVV